HSTVGNSVLTSNVAAPTPLPVAVAAGSNIADSFNLSGFIGGFQGGCNYQVGAWVWGHRSPRLRDQQRGPGAGRAARAFQPGQEQLGFPNAGALARDRARPARLDLVG